MQAFLLFAGVCFVIGDVQQSTAAPSSSIEHPSTRPSHFPGSDMMRRSKRRQGDQVTSSRSTEGDAALIDDGYRDGFPAAPSRAITFGDVEEMQVKTGNMKRATEEYETYLKGEAVQRAKIGKMKREGEDENDVKKQIEVLNGFRMILPDARQRLKKYGDELTELLDHTNADIEMSEAADVTISADGQVSSQRREQAPRQREQAPRQQGPARLPRHRRQPAHQLDLSAGQAQSSIGVGSLIDGEIDDDLAMFSFIDQAPPVEQAAPAAQAAAPVAQAAPIVQAAPPLAQAAPIVQAPPLAQAAAPVAQAPAYPVDPAQNPYPPYAAAAPNPLVQAPPPPAAGVAYSAPQNPYAPYAAAAGPNPLVQAPPQAPGAPAYPAPQNAAQNPYAQNPYAQNPAHAQNPYAAAAPAQNPYMNPAAANPYATVTAAPIAGMTTTGSPLGFTTTQNPAIRPAWETEKQDDSDSIGAWITFCIPLALVIAGFFIVGKLITVSLMSSQSSPPGPEESARRSSSRQSLRQSLTQAPSKAELKATLLKRRSDAQLDASSANEAQAPRSHYGAPQDADSAAASAANAAAASSSTAMPSPSPEAVAVLNAKEAGSCNAVPFEKMDVDGDGVVSKDEYEKAMASAAATPATPATPAPANAVEEAPRRNKYGSRAAAKSAEAPAEDGAGDAGAASAAAAKPQPSRSRSPTAAAAAALETQEEEAPRRNKYGSRAAAKSAEAPAQDGAGEAGAASAAAAQPQPSPTAAAAAALETQEEEAPRRNKYGSRAAAKSAEAPAEDGAGEAGAASADAAPATQEEGSTRRSKYGNRAAAKSTEAPSADPAIDGDADIDVDDIDEVTSKYSRRRQPSQVGTVDKW